MTTYKAGQILTADDLNQSAPGSAAARASGSISPVTTTPTDMPGASVTVTTTAANTVAFVVAAFDFHNSGNDVALGTLVVDGVTQGGVAVQMGAGRQTVCQTWAVTLATAGAHTLKLQVSKSGAAGTLHCYGTHTVLNALIAGI